MNYFGDRTVIRASLVRYVSLLPMQMITIPIAHKKVICFGIVCLNEIVTLEILV